MSSCKVCDELPPKQVRSINRHLRAGKKTIKQIAKHYHIETEDLQVHLNCIGEVLDEDQELQRTQHQLTRLIEQFQHDVNAGRHLEFDPESGVDGRGVIRDLLSAMREHRETVLARKRLRSSDELYQDLRAIIVDPLINGITVILVNEAKRLREDLFDVTKHLQDDRLPARIKQAIDEMLTRAADRFVSDALQDIQQKVQAVATAKAKRPATPAQH